MKQLLSSIPYIRKRLSMHATTGFAFAFIAGISNTVPTASSMEAHAKIHINLTVSTA